MKAIIIPGNGGDKPEDKWFPYVKKRLDAMNIPTENVEFPDAILARKEFWLPFIAKLGGGPDAILIGHSSGAVAAMRYAEKNKILGSVLVGVCYTDLGIQSEKDSGYYDTPWDWDAIRQNQKWIVQFASTDDPFIPISEARFIRDHLHTEYHEYSDKGHFMLGTKTNGAAPDIEFPELIDAIKAKIIL